MAWIGWIWVLWCGLAAAHPFGSSFYGHQLEVSVQGETVTLDYLAEIPTPVLLRELRHELRDVASPDASHQAAFTAAKLDELAGGLRLRVDGVDSPLTRLDIEAPSGLGDTRFITYRLRLQGALPDGAQTLHIINGNLPDERSLFSTTLMVDAWVEIDACSLYDVREGAVRADRAGQWRGEETNRELRVSLHRRSPAEAALQRGMRVVTGEGDGLVPARSVLSAVETDPLLALVQGRPTPAMVAWGLLIAVVLGAAHALSPGHGKALVAAYLLGSRRTVVHAVWLGVVVTITHTLGVYALAGLAWGLEDLVDPEALMPWMEFASGALVLGLGVMLIRQRWRSLRAPPGAPDDPSDGEHDHRHSHGHAAAHRLAPPMVVPAASPGFPLSITPIGASGNHPAPAVMGGHAHGGGSHGHGHSHAPPDSFRELVAMGVSGGLAPCPSALVLLLTAMSFQQLGLGLLLVAAFSLGLALLVTAVGVVVILAGDRVGQLTVGGRLVGRLSVLSAVVVAALGVLMTLRGVGAIVGAG